jgi:hypothetical protein
LLFQQNKNERFNRFDIIVRYLAIEHYYGGNNFGLELYEKMQSLRRKQEWVKPDIFRFKKLIESYEDGYDNSSKIELDRNLNLIDGSHRMALALYHNIFTISCIVRPCSADIFYGIEWFVEHDFTVDEINIVLNKYKEIRDKIMEPFACTLWPPVQEYFDEIVEKLSLLVDIVKYEDYVFDNYTFNAITRGIYSIDDIEKWKIDKKIEKMNNTRLKKIRMILVNVEKPNFRLKALNNNTISITGENIKKIIRNAYKDKINDYFYDIIMHIGDNYRHNIFIRKLFNISVNVREIIESISNFNYAISKTDVPYMPPDFPIHYPLNKDIDILCTESDYNSMVDTVIATVKKYDKEFCTEIIRKHTSNGKEYRTLIRIELETYLIIQFDISCHMKNMTNDFICDLVLDRENKNSYYAVSHPFEYLIRLVEVFEHPNKTHHIEYLKNHQKDFDYELCERYLNFEWKKIMNYIQI